VFAMPNLIMIDLAILKEYERQLADGKAELVEYHYKNVNGYFDDE